MVDTPYLPYLGCGNGGDVGGGVQEVVTMVVVMMM